MTKIRKDPILRGIVPRARGFFRSVRVNRRFSVGAFHELLARGTSKIKSTQAHTLAEVAESGSSAHFIYNSIAVDGERFTAFHSFRSPSLLKDVHHVAERSAPV